METKFSVCGDWISSKADSSEILTYNLKRISVEDSNNLHFELISGSNNLFLIYKL